MVNGNSSVPKKSSKTQEAGGGPEIGGAQDKEFSKNKNGTVKSLRKSEKLFYVLFNQAADAVFLLDPRQADNPLIVDANMAACKMHGYAYEELIGKPISAIYKNLDKKQVQNRTRHLLEGEHLIFEVEHMKKDGLVFPVEVSAQIVDIQGLPFIQAVDRDISERKKAEEKIVQVKNDWQDTFDNISDMITIHDKDFNILRANKAAKKILKLPLLTEIKSKCYKCFHGTDSPPKSCPSCDCLKHGKSVNFEMFEPHLDKFIEIQAMPRFNADKKIIGVIHVVRDISRRKKNEEELRIAREGLEQKVAERTKELNKLNKKLEERIKAHKSAEETLVDSYRYLGIANRRMSIVLDLKNKVKDKTQSEVIESIVDVATEFSNASVCVLFSCEAEDQSFHLLSANGIENKKGLQRKIPMKNNSLLRELIGQKKIINVVSENINYGDLSQMNIDRRLKQVILFPIFSEGNIKYCILFGFIDENVFSAQDTNFYEAFMKQAALALQDTEVYHV